MENLATKKYWETPTIQVLDIKKDTFSGSSDKNEQSSHDGAKNTGGGNDNPNVGATTNNARPNR